MLPCSSPLHWHLEQESTFSVSSSGQWLPAPWGWLPSAGSEPAHSAASGGRVTLGSVSQSQLIRIQITQSHLRWHIFTSLAFCLSLSCSGSSCRDRDCGDAEDTLIFQDGYVQFIQSIVLFIRSLIVSISALSPPRKMYINDTDLRSLTRLL